MGLDLETINQSVTKLRADIPEDAFTAGILGSQRIGNGVVIDAAGLVLTIGYLMTEATDVWLTNAAGREIAAHPLAYDQVTGFGLVLPLQKLDAPAVTIGSSEGLRAGSEVHVLSAKDFAPPQTARVCRRVGISAGGSDIHRSSAPALVRRCVDRQSRHPGGTGFIAGSGSHR